jgi:hypothetical protein
MQFNLDIFVMVLGIGGTIFGVYSYFRNPQIDSEKVDVVFSERLNVLSKELANLRDNHIHTLDLKIDSLTVNQTSMLVQLGKLSTVIDERIPRKNV